MTHITLIRHGQANTHATTAEDYDRLSELGQQQAAWLGQYLHETQAQFDHVWAGDMSRHLATARGKVEEICASWKKACEEAMSSKECQGIP